VQPISAAKAIDLWAALRDTRQLCLHPALNAAVADLGVARIDPELARLVPAAALNHVATLGLRGERVFPVPVVLAHSPRLIGYYRMLLGLSRLKDFIQKYGYGAWARAEESGVLPARLHPQLESFCAHLIAPLAELVVAMNTFEDRDLSDLALLTLGPTLQGSRNNAIGRAAAEQVFKVVRQLIDPDWITAEIPGAQVQFRTAARVTYELTVSSDPDLSLKRGAGSTAAPLLAIEIKGGSDSSNAHNRAGEAEKSQLKARDAGYAHRWTVIKMGRLSHAMIQSETPSTTDLFEFLQVIGQTGPTWAHFRDEFLAIIGTGTAGSHSR
jgi:hypothetical protein